MTAAEAPSSFRLVGSWVGTHLLAVVTVAGFVTYGLMRLSYATFYRRFDVEPEEVGLGQAEILAQTGLVMFLLTVYVGGFLVLEYLALRAFGLPAPRPAPPRASLWTQVRLFLISPYWLVLLPTLALVAVFVFSSLPGHARELADRVERGDPVRPAAGF